MAWTANYRGAADRRGLRYPSNLTDAEWAVVAPMIRPAKRGGRPRNAALYRVVIVRMRGHQPDTGLRPPAHRGG